MEVSRLEKRGPHLGAVTAADFFLVAPNMRTGIDTSAGLYDVAGRRRDVVYSGMRTSATHPETSLRGFSKKQAESRSTSALAVCGYTLLLM